MRVSPPAEAAWRLLRYEILQMCTHAGVTHKEIGQRLGMSRASFSQIVGGKNLPSQPAVEIMAYYLDYAHRTEYLLYLLKRARTARSRPDLGDDDRQLALGLEAFARSITIFDPADVPQLLQTASYARDQLAVQASISHGLDIDEQLRLLAHRQQAIASDENSASLLWIAEEHALRRRAFDAAVLVTQFQHLLTMSERPNVTIQVIPAHTPVEQIGAFQLIEADDGRVVAHQQTRQSAYYYDSSAAVADYTQLATHLRKKALDPERSQQLIVHMAKASDEIGGSGASGR